jgi:hypothetical protein
VEVAYSDGMNYNGEKFYSIGPGCFEKKGLTIWSGKKRFSIKKFQIEIKARTDGGRLT